MKQCFAAGFFTCQAGGAFWDGYYFAAVLWQIIAFALMLWARQRRATTPVPPEEAPTIEEKA